MKEENNLSEIIEKEEEEGDVYVHKFTEPFVWEGKTYGELAFHFEKLTGKDALAIEEELKAQKHFVVVAELDMAFKMRVAVRACEAEIGVDALTCNHAVALREIWRRRF